MSVDPVCGLEVRERRRRGGGAPRGRLYYFCSLEHERVFSADPAAFVDKVQAMALEGRGDGGGLGRPVRGRARGGVRGGCRHREHGDDHHHRGGARAAVGIGARGPGGRRPLHRHLARPQPGRARPRVPLAGRRLRRHDLHGQWADGAGDRQHPLQRHGGHLRRALRHVGRVRHRVRRGQADRRARGDRRHRRHDPPTGGGHRQGDGLPDRLRHRPGAVDRSHGRRVRRRPTSVGRRSSSTTTTRAVISDRRGEARHSGPRSTWDAGDGGTASNAAVSGRTAS